MPSGGRPDSSRISVSLSADSGVSDAGLMTTELPPASAGPTLWHTRLSGKLSGVSDAGLMTTELPPASAGPTLWHTRLSGKLNGVIAATTPHGTRSVKPSFFAPVGSASSGTVSP